MWIPVLWRPEAYQGSRRKHRYFEGWYSKVVSEDLSEAWSFIFGIARAAPGGIDSSFMQIIEGRTARTWWFETEAADFEASAHRFFVRVGDSTLSHEGMTLNVGTGSDRLLGQIRFLCPQPTPSRLFSPGIMGWYGLLPFMECKHGLVSLDHGLEGGFEIGGRRVELDGGRGYIEKDWGSSMPSNWIWTQSNNFGRAGDSLMFSIATVPWLGSCFPGFICVGRLGGRSLLEATYTGARVLRLEVDDGQIRVIMERKRERVELVMSRTRGGILRAPSYGSFTRRIAESVDATLSVRWSLGADVLYEGSARKAGLEIVGQPGELAP
jgi:hypothetical protein